MALHHPIVNLFLQMPFFGDSMMILLTFAAVYAVNYAPSFIREPLNHRYVKMFFKIGQG